MQTNPWKPNPWLVRRALAPMLRLLMAVALVTSTLLALSAGPSLAAPLAVEPKDITLTLGDLQPGFRVDPKNTGTSQVEQVGPSAQVQFERAVSPEALLQGPVIVGQIVIRLDTGIGAGDALTFVRQMFIETQGMVPSNLGPNDGGTFTLLRQEGDIVMYSVGFIKENMIIVTMTAGLAGVVSPQGALDLAGVSSAKLDSALGR